MTQSERAKLIHLASKGLFKKASAFTRMRLRYSLGSVSRSDKVSLKLMDLAMASSPSQQHIYYPAATAFEALRFDREGRHDEAEEAKNAAFFEEETFNKIKGNQNGNQSNGALASR